MSELDELIKMIKLLSYERKKVILASGKESDFYVDMRNTLLHPKGCHLVSKLIAENLKYLDGKLKAVGGMTMGADPISTSVSLATLSWNTPLMALYIRKEPKGHGNNQWIEGLKNLKKGDLIYIVEDTVTTGGSSLKAVSKAKEAGLEVMGIFACVDREEGGKEKIENAGLEFKTLVKRTDLLK